MKAFRTISATLALATVLATVAGAQFVAPSSNQREGSLTVSFENYYKNMGRMAQGITGASFLPLWATRTFAHSLGYLLLAFGVCLLLGLKTRTVLMLTGLLYVGLSFGLMAVQEGDGVAWLGMHILMF